MPATTRAEKRVIALCNAISNLHHGDLLTACKLDEVAPINVDVAEKEGEVTTSLRHRAGTGVDLGRILEQHLIEVMGFGELWIPSSRKAKGRYERELGGCVFHDD